MTVESYSNVLHHMKSPFSQQDTALSIYLPIHALPHLLYQQNMNADISYPNPALFSYSQVI